MLGLQKTTLIMRMMSSSGEKIGSRRQEESCGHGGHTRDVLKTEGERTHLGLLPGDIGLYTITFPCAGGVVQDEEAKIPNDQLDSPIVL
jgi:hypothetical protein